MQIISNVMSELVALVIDSGVVEIEETVTGTEGEKCFRLNLYLSQADLAQALGRNGELARAFRHLFYILANTYPDASLMIYEDRKSVSSGLTTRLPPTLSELRERVVKVMVVLLRLLVDTPASLTCNVLSGTSVTVLEITSRQHDYRFIIGERGRTIKALRTILNALSGRWHHRFELQLNELRARVSVDQEQHP